MFNIKCRNKLNNKIFAFDARFFCNNNSPDHWLKSKNFKKYTESTKGPIMSLGRIYFRVLCVLKETVYFCVSVISAATNWEPKRTKLENFHFTWWGHRQSLNILRHDASLSCMATLSRLEKSSWANELAKRVNDLYVTLSKSSFGISVKKDSGKMSIWS